MKKKNISKYERLSLRPNTRHSKHAPRPISTIQADANDPSNNILDINQSILDAYAAIFEHSDITCIIQRKGLD